MSEHYEVRINACPMSEHKTEALAIAEAQSYNDETASVAYISVSGTETSKMQVWPTTGQMYSHHS